MKGATPRTLDWKSILAGLAQLHRDNPQILESNVLVGGAACMFYRDQLERINDADFQVRIYNEEEEKFWHSRDADFATTEPEQMPDNAGNVPLGRLQMGFVLGAEEFRENARNVRVQWDGTEFAMLIADPLDMWREKEAAAYRRARAQDSLHLEVLGITLQWEMVYYAEKVARAELDFHHWKTRSDEVKRRWNSILQNPRLVSRLLALNIADVSDYAVARG